MLEKNNFFHPPHNLEEKTFLGNSSSRSRLMSNGHTYLRSVNFIYFMNVELSRDDFSIDDDERCGELLQVGEDGDESCNIFYLETGSTCNA